MEELGQLGFRIIYIDEICVTKATIPSHEYSPEKKPLEIDLKNFSNKTIAVIAGISGAKGIEVVRTFERSVNTAKFIGFLQYLRGRNPDEKIALFMDRLSVHMSLKVQKKMNELGIRYVYNSAYSPNFNPIENVFSIVKKHIKTERLRKFILNKEEDLPKIIKEQFRKI